MTHERVAGQGRDYMAPSARIMATEIFVLGFIFRFQMREIGIIPSAQSVAHEIAEYAYVASTVIFESMQVPFPPVYRVQKYAAGKHCMTKSKK